MDDQIQCAVCGTSHKQITKSHVKTHGFESVKEYLDKYPESKVFSDHTLKARSKSRGLKIDNPINSSAVESDFHVSKNRTKKRISYDEFLEKIQENSFQS